MILGYDIFIVQITRGLNAIETENNLTYLLSEGSSGLNVEGFFFNMNLRSHTQEDIVLSKALRFRGRISIANNSALLGPFQS